MLQLYPANSQYTIPLFRFILVLILFNFNPTPSLADCENAENAKAPEFPSVLWGDISQNDLNVLDSEVHLPEKTLASIRENLKKYHSIEKSKLHERVNLLDHILVDSQNLINLSPLAMESESTRAQIESLKTKAAQKKKYLEGILEIPIQIQNYKTEMEERERSLAYENLLIKNQALKNFDKPLQSSTLPCTGDDKQGASNTPSSASFSAIIPSYEDHILPQLDPAYRDSSCIASLHKEFLRQNPSEAKIKSLSSAFDFYVWLESFDFPTTKKGLALRFRHDPTLQSSLSECLEKRMEHTTTIEGRAVHFGKDGLSYNLAMQDLKSPHYVCDEHGKKVHSILDGKYIYNIDDNGDLFISKDRDLGGSRLLGHILITRKFIIPAAGEVVFKNGKISSLNSNSGHYQPSEEAMKKAAELLMRKHDHTIFNPHAQVRDHHDSKVLLEVN
jgi:hypothetical protein